MVIRFDMCTNQRKIRNRYTGHTLYVKCGKCPACMQEKAAHRVSRIKAQDDPEKYDVALVGLTYSRHCCPYVLRDEAYLFTKGLLDELPIYRDSHYRKVRQSSSYDVGYKNIRGRRQIDTIELPDENFRDSFSLYGTKDLAKVRGHIGVCWYKDYQHFLARLRLNLKRNFFYEKDLKVFSCSEYGAKSFRPHFHLLLWIPKGDFEIVRSAAFASWPYGDISKWSIRTSDGIPHIEYDAFQKAFNASSYVASYVNCGSDFPSFLKVSARPKHSYSKGFGCSNKLFLLPKILEKFRGGHLTYRCARDKHGHLEIVELPFPKYIIHRYFPKFKGYGRLDPTALCSCMQRISGLTICPDGYENVRFLPPEFYEEPFCSDLEWVNRVSRLVGFEYTDEEFHAISVRLNNAYARFCSFLPDGLFYSFDEYCRLHRDVWNLYSSDVLRLHLQNDDIPLEEKYDNLKEVFEECKYFGDPLPVGFTERMMRYSNPNDFVSVRFHTQAFEKSFHDNIKHRRVRNVQLSQVSEEF